MKHNETSLHLHTILNSQILNKNKIKISKKYKVINQKIKYLKVKIKLNIKILLIVREIKIKKLWAAQN